MSPEPAERARAAHEAADSAHELERMLLSVSHALRRGEAPDATTLAFIPATRDRLNALIALAGIAPTAKESTMQHYVIRMRDTSYAVVGPFETQAAAAEWGRRDQDLGGDDPRWQVLQLADPHAVRVVRPDWTPAVAP